jgi:hypothetical protein
MPPKKNAGKDKGKEVEAEEDAFEHLEKYPLVPLMLISRYG